MQLYENAGFQVKRIHMDGQFEGIQDNLTAKRQGPWIDITSRDEHVPEVECYIHTIKEQVRCVYNTQDDSRDCIQRSFLAELIP